VPPLNPFFNGKPKYRDFPMALPDSLDIATLRLPVPMTEADHAYIVAALMAMKPAMTRQPVVELPSDEAK
jgi:hypothetical protein